jgi:hypothetical protein
MLSGGTMKRLGLVLFLCLMSSAALAGPTSAERKSQFERALSLIMAAATPQIATLNRDALIKDYIKAKPNKAQAVQLVDGHYFRSAEHEDMSVTGDRTLEACQLRYGKPCALIAVNDEIASEGELISKDMLRLRYAGEFDLSQIPIIRDVTRNRADVQAYFSATEPKAIAIHPWGFLFISAGKPNIKEAQETALSNCNEDPRRRYQDGQCFLYAINNKVVLPERLMHSK